MKQTQANGNEGSGVNFKQSRIYNKIHLKVDILFFPIFFSCKREKNMTQIQLRV